MKTKLTKFLALAITTITLGIFTTSVSASTTFVDFQTISGSRSSDSFGWGYSYDIGYFDDAIQVDVDVLLTGIATTLEHRGIWENGFEDIWSVDATRFGVAMNFNLDWVTSDSDLIVNVIQSGGGNLSTWPIEQNWGPTHYGAFAAHELGHQLGLFDEYSGGAVDLDHSERLNSGGLMHTLDGGTLDYYYDDFLSWHTLNVVPEPSSFFLLGYAGIALVLRRTRS